MADTTRPRMWVLHAASHALTEKIELRAPAESRAAVAVAETTRVVRAIDDLAKARLNESAWLGKSHHSRDTKSNRMTITSAAAIVYKIRLPITVPGSLSGSMAHILVQLPAVPKRDPSSLRDRL